MEWLLGIIGVCSVTLLFIFPIGLLSSSISVFFMCSIIGTIMIIIVLMKRSKPIFFFSIIVMTIIVLQMITLFVYPTIIKAFH